MKISPHCFSGFMQHFADTYSLYTYQVCKTLNPNSLLAFYIHRTTDLPHLSYPVLCSHWKYTCIWQHDTAKA